MTTILRDGSKVTDPRCGLIREVDPNPTNLYSLAPPDPLGWENLEVISKRRVKTFGEPHLDQGNLGACGGFGSLAAWGFEPWIHEIAARQAVDLYFFAQKEDEFPGGEYPGAFPQAGGTSILAVLKVMKRLGLIDGWVEAKTFKQVLIGIGYFGSAILGMEWTEDMVNPDKGICHPSGSSVGGHCTAATWINKDLALIGGPNSWGDEWNPAGHIPGDWCMTLAGFKKQFARDGQCYFIIKKP